MDDEPREVHEADLEGESNEVIASINATTFRASALIGKTIDTSGILSTITNFHESALAGLKVLPRFNVPTLNVDFSSLLPDMTKFNENIMKSLEPVIADFNKRYAAQFDEIAKNLAKIAARAYPPNWQLDDGLVRLPDDLETLLINEGIPLAWVPPTHVLEKLFAAQTPGERRRVLSSNWKAIVTECTLVLNSVEEKKLAVYVEFAREASETLAEGRWKASQALSTNILDSFLHQKFTTASRKALTNQKQRVDWQKFPMRVALVVGALSGGYAEYWPKNGEEIPKQFSRHASAHGLSSRQYSRLNAVIALMNVVGLIKVSETDLYRWDEPEAGA